MGPFQEIWIYAVYFDSQSGFTINKVVFTNNVIIGTYEWCIYGKPVSQITKDTIYFPAFGVFKRKDLIVESYRFFRFNERRFPAITLAMQNAFNLAFMFSKKSHYAPAI